jgi:hypothetical protein
VIRTDTLGEVFDVAGLLAGQPPPARPRVGVVTNGGGLGILCADACQAAGLDVVETPPATQASLLAELPEGAAVGNPVDLLASASPQRFAHAIAALDASGAVDSIVVLYVPPLVTDPEAVARAVRAAADAAKVPVVAVFAMPDAPPWWPAAVLPLPRGCGAGPRTRRALWSVARRAARARPGSGRRRRGGRGEVVGHDHALRDHRDRALGQVDDLVGDAAEQDAPPRHLVQSTPARTSSLRRSPTTASLSSRSASTIAW